MVILHTILSHISGHSRVNTHPPLFGLVSISAHAPGKHFPPYFSIPASRPSPFFTSAEPAHLRFFSIFVALLRPMSMTVVNFRNEGLFNVPPSAAKKVRDLSMSTEEWHNINGGYVPDSGSTHECKLYVRIGHSTWAQDYAH